MLGYKKPEKRRPRVLNLNKRVKVSFDSTDDGYVVSIQAPIKSFATSDEAQTFLEKIKKTFTAFTIDLYNAEFFSVPDVLEAAIKQLKPVVYNGFLGSSSPILQYPIALYFLDITPTFGGGGLTSINFLPGNFTIFADSYGYTINIVLPVPISL